MKKNGFLLFLAVCLVVVLGSDVQAGCGGGAKLRGLGQKIFHPFHRNHSASFAATRTVTQTTTTQAYQAATPCNTGLTYPVYRVYSSGQGCTTGSCPK